MTAKYSFLITVALVVVAFSAGILIAQENPLTDIPECEPAALANEMERLPKIADINFENAPLESREQLFQLSIRYLDLALLCGYEPTDSEKQFLIEQVLSIATLQDITEARAVGEDVDAALDEIAELNGSSMNGQLLYNGVETGLSGASLGCAGCHTGASAGPATAGTYTRAEERIQTEDALNEYTVTEYLVESILHPNAYIVDGYGENLMPQNYASRIDPQQLADLIAFLESQDQLINNETDTQDE